MKLLNAFQEVVLKALDIITSKIYVNKNAESENSLTQKTIYVNSVICILIISKLANNLEVKIVIRNV